MTAASRQAGFTLVTALVAVALLGLLMAGVVGITRAYMSARQRQVASEAGATVEDAAINAMGDVFRRVPLTTQLNCANLSAAFNNVAIGAGSRLFVTASVPPLAAPPDRGDFAAAKARCRTPRIPGANAAGAPFYFCATFATTPGSAAAPPGSFLRSDQAFVEISMSFMRLSDRQPLSCSQLRRYALGAGAEISYRLYWRNHAVMKSEPVFNTLARTIITDLTPGP